MKSVFSFIVLLTICSCSPERSDSAATQGPIRVAVLPDQTKDRLVAQYTPLLHYLESATSLKFELEIPLNYSGLLERFENGHVDLAWFGGLTFTQAEQNSQALPLVFRDIDLEFTSCYMAKASDDRNSIVDFSGEQFSFGPRLSTSGHLMPRYFMETSGLDPDSYFADTRHSPGHDRTVEWVANGSVALGVANCSIARTLIDEGRLSSSDIHIIETTPPYADYVWAVRASLDQQIVLSILNAFLALDPTVDEHREMLRQQGANSYLPAGSEDFDSVRIAAIRAGLLQDRSSN